jgi:ligand-binding sensor domain-containing protein
MISMTIVAVSLFPGVVWSQHPEWINFTCGLNVRAIADAGEYLWVGTEGGLVHLSKATGEMTLHNRANSGLPGNVVNALVLDAQGNLWIGTGYTLGILDGLARFDGRTWTVYTRNNSGLENDIVRALVLDRQGNLWIGTYGAGLARFDGEHWSVYRPSNSGLPDNRIGALMFDAEGILWIGTCEHHTGGSARGLVRFDGETWTVYNPSNSGLPHNYIHGMAIDEEGNIWMTSPRGGLIRFDGENVEGV